MRRDGMRYEHVLSFALEHPWATTPSMRAVIAGILTRRLVGQAASDEDIATALQMRASRPLTIAPASGTVRVIPIHGVIAPRMNLFSDISGGATFEGLSADLDEALATPNLSAIVFDVDSPGGNVAGATEFAKQVLKARTQVPIIAQANHMVCSAAYWVMACATEIVASPSSLVGSIGVYALHNDVSAALEQVGIKRTVYSAGKYKAEGVDGGPLNEAAATHVQTLVDTSYERFVGDVAKGRGVSANMIRAGYGEGRALSAEQALAAKMIDRIATLADTLERLTGSAPGTGALAALLPATTSAIADQESRQHELDPAFVAFEQELLQLERMTV